MVLILANGMDSDTRKAALAGRHESRRSTRVRIRVRIDAKGVAEPLICEGETIIVNLHGALLLTTVALRVGMQIELHIILTDERALAEVVYVDPDQPKHCGVGLMQPDNIWGGADSTR